MTENLSPWPRPAPNCDKYGHMWWNGYCVDCHMHEIDYIDERVRQILEEKKDEGPSTSGSA